MGPDLQRRDQMADRLARRIAELGMTAPAILFLEAYKPLSFLGAQLLWVLQPFLSLVVSPDGLRDFALLMQDDVGTETLISRLESTPMNDSTSQSRNRS